MDKRKPKLQVLPGGSEKATPLELALASDTYEQLEEYHNHLISLQDLLHLSKLIVQSTFGEQVANNYPGVTFKVFEMVSGVIRSGK